MGAEYKYQLKPNELLEFLQKLDGLEKFKWLNEANDASLPQAMLSEAPLTCKPSKTIAIKMKGGSIDSSSLQIQNAQRDYFQYLVTTFF